MHVRRVSVGTDTDVSATVCSRTSGFELDYVIDIKGFVPSAMNSHEYQHFVLFVPGLIGG